MDCAEAGAEEGGAAEDATTLNRRAAGLPGILDRRALAAAFALSAEWKVQLRLPPRPQCREPPHINVLEARASMLSMRKLVKQGVQNSRIVVLSDLGVCVGAFSKGRSSSRKLNAVIRRVGALLHRSGCTLDVFWILTWANPADAPSRGASLEEWRAKVPAAPSLELFRCSAPEEHRDMWNRILGPSEAFVGRLGVMKRFFSQAERGFLKWRRTWTPVAAAKVRSSGDP